MTELLQRQQQLCRSIARYLDNFKKIGRANLTAAKVRSRISALKDLWIQFQDGHAALMNSTPLPVQKTTEYFTEHRYDETEDTYRTALDHMSEELEELDPPVSPSHDSSHLLHNRSQVSAVSLAQLPPIRLPPFDGNLNDWESFRDRFSSLIIQNQELNNFSRMHFLTSSLRGQALDCLSNLAITAANFDVAWHTLVARYEDKSRLLRVHLSALLNLPSVSRESAADIQALRDQAHIAVASLTRLARSPADLWNDILVYLVVQKLDAASRKAWRLKTADQENLPSFSELENFLANRSRALDDVSCVSGARAGNRRASSTRISVATASTSSGSICPLCKAHHYFSSCPIFEKASPVQRRELVKKHGRCFNCLSQHHSVRSCSSKYSCRSCHERHHSLLHTSPRAEPSLSNDLPGQQSKSRAETKLEVNSMLASPMKAKNARIILATARVRVGVLEGRSVEIRALLDQGSEMSFISEYLAQLLRVKRIRMPTSVSAVGCVDAGTFKYAARICVSHRDAISPTVNTTALILSSLTSYVPQSEADIASFSHLADLAFADPDPTSKEPIHLILGADLYGEIILGGLRKGSLGEPIAQNSIFGWVISGPLSPSSHASHPSPPSPGDSRMSHRVSVHHCLNTPSLEDEIRRFWEIEDFPTRSIATPDDEKCEMHFRSTHTRTPTGRYIVRLPFRREFPIDIGESRRRAEQRLNSLFRRFGTNPEQFSEYQAFIREYERLGHSRKMPAAEDRSDPRVYLPHHPVFRESSSTTRLRVVFDASSLTSNGTSLNNHLLTGPKLQTDLSAVILRWRQFRFVYSADIAKMYRQILVDDRDLNFQRILWRDSSREPVADFQLLTVTYGMACAPFLALRVIQQLAQDEGNRYPMAVPILRDHIYVDDVLFGHDDLIALRAARDQLVSLLRRGGFELRKWAANSAALLSDMDDSEHGTACDKSLSYSDNLNILGVEWNPVLDAFQIRVSMSDDLPRTKRSILAAIARLYDPLGWVTPVILSAKVLMQILWKTGLSWDEPISPSLFRRWQQICCGISHLSNLRLPRWSGFTANCGLELHGFADASTVAYAAAVYLKVVDSSQTVTISLLLGKSRVAPLKPLSIPRLELLGAALLARLINFVKSTLAIDDLPCVCWSDSTVVLAWLRQHPSRWKTFVANRVADIQQRLPRTEWRYVATADNPADCASRGLSGDDLLSHSLWWHGPAWLAFPSNRWPHSLALPPDAASLEANTHSFTSSTVPPPSDDWCLREKYSSWPKLLRVTSYVLRFIARCRKPAQQTEITNQIQPFLSAREVEAARIFWLRRIQRELFATEIRDLEQQRRLSLKSSILSLAPFLDRDGLLRVGGRLQRSCFPSISRHPILLADHPLVKLIVEQTHLRGLHAGLQLTLSILRRDFWVLRARTIAKAIIYKCIACTRERAAVPTQLMGSLPAIRVTAPPRSFTHCGLDYAGPVSIRASAGRGITSRKAYIALFVCLSSRAIHLELVSDYSSPAFLNAYTRFCARRGLPQSMYSDNGTTFVGASRELRAAYRSAVQDPNFQNRVASDEVNWQFIPPSAPHFGGLWEAGVKSVKHHLRRVLGTHTLTFEEFTTLLCKIEACLNSRPLAPLSDSLDDCNCLTPGHFLIGSAITTSPEPTLLHLNENRLSRWQLIRQMTERFWRLWCNDYVNTLQQRSKWRRKQASIPIGKLVLLRNSNLPPSKWELGRIIQCHPGTDGLTRVVTVKTAVSEYTRAIGKVCLLPVDCEPIPSATTA